MGASLFAALVVLVISEIDILAHYKLIKESNELSFKSSYTNNAYHKHMQQNISIVAQSM